jgi:hypothetical protein
VTLGIVKYELLVGLQMMNGTDYEQKVAKAAKGEEADGDREFMWWPNILRLLCSLSSRSLRTSVKRPFLGAYRL